MLQTQLLRLEPPYQIISYGGEVALHVATLIVTQETTDAKGKTKLETHCRPVVNYSRKEYFTQDPQRLEKHLHSDLYPVGCTAHPSAEGTIWDDADVARVKVLGIEGITTELDWMALAQLLSSAKDSNNFNYRIRRVFACLRDLGIRVKGYESDPVVFIVDAYESGPKQFWTDVYVDKSVIYSAPAKSMKAAQKAWVEVAYVFRKFLAGSESAGTIMGAEWNENKELKKLTSEASHQLWTRENPVPDEEVQD